MTIKQSICAFAAASALLGGSALAQFQTSPSGGSQTTTPSGAGIAGQSEDAKLSFKDLEFTVDRLIEHPSDGTLRLMMTVVEKSKSPRYIAFIQPQGRLLDDVGNSYLVTASSGVDFCYNSKPWDYNAKNCVKYQTDDLKQLGTDIPMRISITLTPSESEFSEELAELAGSATFSSRLVVMVDGQQFEQVDITIPDLQLP